MGLLSWEGRRHRPGGAWAVLIRIGSVIATLYVLWIGALAQIIGNAALWLALNLEMDFLRGFAAWARSYTANWHLDISIFIAVTFPIAFLTTTGRRSRTRLAWTDVALAALSFGAALYYIVLHDKFLHWSRGFSQPTTADILVGLLLLGLVVELCRRTTGWGLTTLVVLLLLFTAFGQWMPGALRHDNFGIVYFTEMMTITENGIYGAPLEVAVALIAAAVAGTRPAGIIQMVAWAFSLAAAGLFAPLVLGIWWKRTTSTGAIVGMMAGFGVCLFYLVATRYFEMPLWFGIRNISSALFGMPVAFIVTYVVSLMTAPPSKEMQEFIDSIRVPKGEVAWAGRAHE